MQPLSTSLHKKTIKFKKLNSVRVWQVLIDAAQRSPSEAKQSILAMRTIRALLRNAVRFRQNPIDENMATTALCW
jgi:hypothetical protein